MGEIGGRGDFEGGYFVGEIGEGGGDFEGGDLGKNSVGGRVGFREARVDLRGGERDFIFFF